MIQRPHRSQAFVHWFNGEECYMLIPYKDKQIRVIIDREDYEAVCQYKWKLYINQARKIAAIRATFDGCDMTLSEFVLSLHNLRIKKGMRFCSGRNILDNRKEALKSCAEPFVSGVSYHKGYNCWIAEICIEGACYSLGKYSSYEAAAEARLQAEENSIMAPGGY